MSDIFISYSRADRDIAQALADHLTGKGYDIWWDYELHAGQRFHQAILEALEASKVAIVIWSATATGSDYVLDEARRARDDSKLISTHIEGFTMRQLPIGFGGLHTIPVIDRDGIEKALQGFGVTGTAESAEPESPLDRARQHRQDAKRKQQVAQRQRQAAEGLHKRATRIVAQMGQADDDAVVADPLYPEATAEDFLSPSELARS